MTTVTIPLQDARLAALLLEGLATGPIELAFGSLLDSRLRVIRPLPVRLSKQDDTCVVECDEIGQFGYGSEMTEALDDFGKTVAEMFFSLEDEFQAGTLGDQLIQSLELLRSFIEPRERPQVAA